MVPPVVTKAAVLVSSRLFSQLEPYRKPLDGCEIRHQKDGWNMLKPYKNLDKPPIWCRISQPSAVFHGVFQPTPMVSACASPEEHQPGTGEAGLSGAASSADLLQYVGWEWEMYTLW